MLRRALTFRKARPAGPRHRSCHAHSRHSRSRRPRTAHSTHDTVSNLRTLRRAPVRAPVPATRGGAATKPATRDEQSRYDRSGPPVNRGTRVRGARWTRRVRSRHTTRAQHGSERSFIFDLVNFTPWFPGCALLRRALAREVRGVTTPCTPPPPHLALLLS